MTFWSSQRLEANLATIVDKVDPSAVDCNAITLRIGGEIYITPGLEHASPNSHTKQVLSSGEPFAIPPGQFAFLLTEERITIPPNAMGFISFKARYKLKGLVNVSGFHVDPGWSGPLIFAVFNAGPASVHLQQGWPLFLLWLADLDADSDKRKGGSVTAGIPPDVINNITGVVDSVYALEKRIKDDLKKLSDKDEGLSNRIHDMEKKQQKVLTWLAIAGVVIGTVLGGVFGTAIKNAVWPPNAPVADTSSVGRPGPSNKSAEKDSRHEASAANKQTSAGAVAAAKPDLNH
ncbi:dCTP deaminase [Anaerolineales bacterium]|nr:dCTP deaminase [Anaerolineales bacterium]